MVDEAAVAEVDAADSRTPAAAEEGSAQAAEEGAEDLAAAAVEAGVKCM